MIDVDALFRAHYLHLVKFVMRKTGDPQLAEDIAQATFLKAFRSAATYEDRGLSPHSWLFKIAANLLTDHWRHVHGCNGTHLDLSADMAMEEGRDIPVQMPAAAHEVEDFTPLLARLTEQQRTAISLTYLEGYSGQEAAEALGTSEEAIKKLKRRGLDNLRRMIEREAA